jgi:hypothetical protein
MMSTQSYSARFPRKAVFPVIHVEDYGQVVHNLEVARTCAVDGVFLIRHHVHTGHWLEDPLVKLIHKLQDEKWNNELWLGANFLGLTHRAAFKQAYNLDLPGVWTDNTEALNPDASPMWAIETNYGRPFPLSFGGVAFKHQAKRGDDGAEARDAAQRRLTDVITTSGPKTGEAAQLEKLALFRKAIANCPLAVASGVTPENAATQLQYVDAILVATGINQNDDSELIDRQKLQQLVDVVRSYQPPN